MAAITAIAAETTRDKPSFRMRRPPSRAPFRTGAPYNARLSTPGRSYSRAQLVRGTVDSADRAEKCQRDQIPKSTGPTASGIGFGREGRR